MKTLSYYKQLRESYACIIPKTAPAYELIEALDALIASLQPDENQPHFLGVPVNLPKGWVIAINHETDTITLCDHRGVDRAYVYRKLNGEYSIFDYHGQQFRIPKGWRMVREGNGDYTLIDASNVAYGKVRRTTEGHAWAYVDRDPGMAGYQSTLRGALLGLIDRAWGSVDAASQPA